VNKIIFTNLAVSNRHRLNSTLRYSNYNDFKELFCVLVDTSDLLLQLISRTVAKQTKGFSNFVEKIRICLPFYLSLDYVCNHISQGAKRIKQQKQAELIPKWNLFS